MKQLLAQCDEVLFQTVLERGDLRIAPFTPTRLLKGEEQIIPASDLGERWLNNGMLKSG